MSTPTPEAVTSSPASPDLDRTAEIAAHTAKSVSCSLPPNSFDSTAVASSANSELPTEITDVSPAVRADHAATTRLAVHVVPKTATNAGNVIDTISENVVSTEGRAATVVPAALSSFGDRGARNDSCGSQGLELHFEREYESQSF